MAKTIISSKYQVIIPKAVRQQAGLKEGQRLNAIAVDNGVLLVVEKSWPTDYIGSQKDIWKQIDPALYLSEERSSWE